MSGIFLWGTAAFAATTITSCEELEGMTDDLDGDYVLGGDIDCNGNTFTPVGEPGMPFTGTFDGDGYTISNLNFSTSDYVGLFGKTEYATIHDVRLSNVSSDGETYIGTLIGSAEYTDVYNASVDAFSVHGSEYVGGLIGETYEGSVRRSFSTNGTVDVDDEAGGGLIGELSRGTHEDLFSREVTVSGMSATFVGGLAGYASAGFTSLAISNVFTDNTVTGSSSVGGLIGGMGGGAVPCLLSNAFAAGSVSGTHDAGKLVGRTTALCAVTNGVSLESPCVASEYSGQASDCTQAGGESDFYDADNAPLSSWNFATTWLGHASDFPSFYWTDNTLPSPPTDLSISYGSTSLTLTWTNPADLDFSSLTIRRGTSGFPASVTNGTLIAANFTGTTITDGGLTAGVRYYYALFPKNTGGDFGPAGTATEIAGRNACMLKAYWKFDETPTSPADATGNGYAGTGTDGIVLSEDAPTTGFINPYSYSFDGGTTSISVSRPVSNDFTLCAWIKTTAEGAGTGGQHYLSRAIAHAEAGGAANDFGFGMNANERLTFGNGNGSTDYGVQGATTINTGNWMHICATREKNNGAIKLYVNGTEDGSGTGSTTSLTANSTMTIGYGTDSGLHWNGLIDDVRVYDRVLYAAEIADIANGTSACFGEASERPASSSSAATAPTMQTAGGGRGKSGTQKIVETLQSRSSAAYRAVSSAASSALPHAAAPAERMSPALQERTCSRVAKWFTSDATMLGRVNARLLKRFGFTCGL